MTRPTMTMSVSGPRGPRPASAPAAGGSRPTLPVVRPAVSSVRPPFTVRAPTAVTRPVASTFRPAGVVKAPGQQAGVKRPIGTGTISARSVTPAGTGAGGGSSQGPAKIARQAIPQWRPNFQPQARVTPSTISLTGAGIGMLPDGEVDSTCRQLCIEGGFSVHDSVVPVHAGAVYVYFPSAEAAAEFKEATKGEITISGKQCGVRQPLGSKVAITSRPAATAPVVAQESSGVPPSSTLLVSKIGEATEAEVKEAIMKVAPRVKAVKLAKTHTGQLKGQAFVSFHELHEATTALHNSLMNGLVVKGKRVVVEYAEPQEKRPEEDTSERDAEKPQEETSQVDERFGQALTGVNANMWASYLSMFNESGDLVVPEKTKPKPPAPKEPTRAESAAASAVAAASAMASASAVSAAAATSAFGNAAPAAWSPMEAVAPAPMTPAADSAPPSFQWGMDGSGGGNWDSWGPADFSGGCSMPAPVDTSAAPPPFSWGAGGSTTSNNNMDAGHPAAEPQGGFPDPKRPRLLAPGVVKGGSPSGFGETDQSVVIGRIPAAGNKAGGGSRSAGAGFSWGSGGGGYPPGLS